MRPTAVSFEALLFFCFFSLLFQQVSMVTAIVGYLLRQGLTESDVVVLTPYSSQLMELNIALAASFNVFVSERDVDQSVRSGLAVTSGDTSHRGVRVATIDNFQGEEANVVVASLVRSNPRRAIGFLREPERVNVLLSRARNGLILVGDPATLTGSPAGERQWGGVLDQLTAAGCVHTAFPAQCQTHGTRPAEPLTTIAAFQRAVPDGGCDQPCLTVLPCGHRCPRRCHPGLDATHDRVLCREEVRAHCSDGHPISKRCSHNRPPKCGTCEELNRIRQTAKDRVAALQAKSDRELAALAVRTAAERAAAAELQGEIQAAEALTAAILAAADAELATERRRRELELRQSLSAITTEAAVTGAQQRAENELQAEEREAKSKAAADLTRARAQLAALNAKKGKSEAELSRLEQSTRDKLAALTIKVGRVEQKAAVAAAAATQSEARPVAVPPATALSFCRALLGVLEGASDGDVSHFLRTFLRDADAVRSCLGDLLGAGAVEVELLAVYLHDPSSDDGKVVAGSLSRGLQLMAKGEWLAAHDLFVSPSGGAAEGAALLAAVCQTQVTGAAAAGELAIEDMAVAPAKIAPAAYLLRGLALAGRGRASGDTPVLWAAFAAALVCSAHPRTPLYPPLASLAADCLRGLAPLLLAPLVNPASMPATAPSAEERERERRRRAGGSKAIGKLLQLTGLSALKDKFLDLQDHVRLDRERGTGDKVQYNALFTGNPGTLSFPLFYSCVADEGDVRARPALCGVCTGPILCTWWYAWH